MFPEALMLHYLDDLDSKMESMRAHFEREIGSEAAWAGYNPSLGRPLLNTAKFLAGKPEVEKQADEAAGTSEPSEPKEKTESNPVSTVNLFKPYVWGVRCFASENSGHGENYEITLDSSDFESVFCTFRM